MINADKLIAVHYKYTVFYIVYIKYIYIYLSLVYTRLRSYETAIVIDWISATPYVLILAKVM